MKKREILLCLFSVLISAILFSQEKKDFVEVTEVMRNRQQQPEKLMDAIGLKEGMTVADIGAGRGRLTVFFALKVGETGKVYANDIDKNSLDYLEDRCKKNNMLNVRTFLGKTDDPMLPSNEVDFAIMIDTFHHLEQPVEMMRSTKPCLKEDGIMVIVERDSIKSRLSPSEKTSKEKLTRLSTEAGFKLIKVNSELLEQDDIYFFKVKK